ncbi:MAG TPA: hypothetical protein VKA48_01855 [Gammaproteobacteria bacterium]|nr:hypothetical protein [Gammaproteobacteria bacterium]
MDTLPHEMSPEELERRMEALGLAPKQLAMLVGVAPQAVYYWLSGERPVPAWLDAVLTREEELRKEDRG